MRLVLPDEGLYLLAEPKSFTKDGEEHAYFKHHAYTTIDDAATAAQQLSAAGTTVFFALASVVNDYTLMNKTQRDAAGVKVRGKHTGTGVDNTHSVRAFWLDLDVGDHPSKYASQHEAATELRAFVKAMGLPRPFVTSSGGGLHVYWPMTHSINADIWATHASVLKALTQAHGLRADPSRTADRASILRPVGTFNWKTGVARPVELLLHGEVSDTQTLLNRLMLLKQQTNIEVYEPRDAVSLLGPVPAYISGGLIPVVNINAEAAAGAGATQPLASQVVRHCPQLMWQKENPQAVSEPQWYAMIGCLRFAEKGDKAIHLMSQGHPQYSQQRTDDKIMQHTNSATGPTLCQTFAMHNPVLCAGCKFNGRVKTPLQAGRELEDAPAPTVEVETMDGAVELTLPPPPHPFKRAKRFGSDHCCIVVHKDSKDDSSDLDEVIYDYDIYPSKITYDERERTYCVAVQRWLPQDGWAEFHIPTGKFYDKRQLAQMLGAIGVMADIGKVDDLVQYMVAYIRELQKHAQANVLYAQLGWRDDKGIFVLPDRVIGLDGVHRIQPSANIQNALNWQEPRGSLDEWKKTVAIFERPGLEGHQFGFGVGFAAPLFKFTNFMGAIVSMVGKKGAGKSSAALCANSIYGHKTMGWLDMTHDTWKAFYGKIGALNNLPCTYDEITNLDPERISDLAYAVTKGQGRQRLQQNGQAQENYGNWNTMMLTTSNSSLHARLSMAKADASAEASRIFEYVLPQNTLTKEEADANFDRLNDHYGVAAEPYVRALLERREATRERVRYWIKEVDRMADVGSSERFWSAVPGTVLAGFELANSIGLTNADIPRLLRFSVAAINRMRGAVNDIVRAPESMVSDYMNSNLRSMLVLTSEPRGTTLATVAIHPSSDKLRIRLERHIGRLYIDRADFRRFCNERNMDAKQVESELFASGVLQSAATKVVLGKGTIYSTTQTWCWLLDFNNPALSGIATPVISMAHDAAAADVAV